MLTKILDVFKGIFDLVSYLKQAWALYKSAKKEGWIQDGQAIAKAIQDASSDEERRALLRKLADHTRNMP